jgi:leader peptidase (prepilin peptidase)/N-methyltransferase
MVTIFFALFGFLIGVFANRVADNFTCQRDLIASPICPNCSTPRPLLDQSALVRLLLGRRKCSNCGVALPWLPPLMELVSAGAFAFLWHTYGATVGLGLAALYTTVFLLVFIIDFQHRLIPNAIILPAIVIAAVASPLSLPGAVLSILGGGISFLFVLVIYFMGKVFERVRGYHIRGGAFGQGDVKLASFMGLVTAFPGAITAIAYALLLGGVGAAAFLIFHGIVYRKLALNKPIPYGPFFCIAGWYFMVMKP